MSDVPSLYRLSTELRTVLEDDAMTSEEAEAAIDRLLPAIEHKAAGVVRWIEYQEDLAAAIKERERQVVEARKTMEARAARWRKYLLDAMNRVEASEIVDKETGIRVKVKQNPPAVVVDDESQIPPDYFVPSEIGDALQAAAKALMIAADWGVPQVQCDPPKEWNLPACGEDPADGWCSTNALAEKLMEIVASTRSLAKKLVTRSIKDGREVPGCHLEQSQRLEIK